MMKEQSLKLDVSSLAFFNVPIDVHAVDCAQTLAARLRQTKPTLFILIGIGGSNVGTLAIFQALQGMLHNDSNPKILFYCLDTIDDFYTSSILAIAERELQKGNRIIINIVTKSGTTTETIVNAALIFDVLNKYKIPYKESMVITTDNGSPLWHLAKKEQLELLEIPKEVGGRYSVFTAVGLFPLALLGNDIYALIRGALAYRDHELTHMGQSEALKSASIIYQQMLHGIVIHNTFLFSPRLLQLGNWYKQLIGESLGKNEKGITPTVSIGTTDLHSVAQLYLDGPHDTFTTFIEPTSLDHLVVPENLFSLLAPLAIGKNVDDIKQRTLEGVMAAYAHAKRPYMHMHLDVTPYGLGYFMMLKMMETVYLAHLMGVNPFDQPAVELYKIETRKRLQ